MITFREALSTADFEIASSLFQEYAESLGIDLEFQNFSKEIATPGQEYTKPHGALFLVFNSEQIVVGCFALRRFEKEIGELKRMYLKQEARGQGIGAMMLQKALSIGVKLGYTRIRLDTLPSMTSAIGLYQKMGFYEIDAYRFNPIAGTKYMEINLQSNRDSK